MWSETVKVFWGKRAFSPLYHDWKHRLHNITETASMTWFWTPTSTGKRDLNSVLPSWLADLRQVNLTLQFLLLWNEKEHLYLPHNYKEYFLMPVSDTSIENYYRNATYWLQDSKNQRQFMPAVKSQTSGRSAVTKGYVDILNSILSRYGQCLIKKNVPVYCLDN